MPAFIREPALVELTLQTVATIQASEPIFFVTMVNRQTVLPRQEFFDALIKAFVPSNPARRLVIDDQRERCVSGTWNEGIRRVRKLCPDADVILIINNDIKLEPTTIDTLADWGRNKLSKRHLLWSAQNRRDVPAPEVGAAETGTDFSCFMVRSDLPETFGEFDENFTPAYYEDNDAYARVVLSGNRAVTITGAGYYHEGSMTIKADPASRQGNNNTFSKNHLYFTQKWGVSEPGSSPEGIVMSYNLHPFGDPSKDLKWWPRPPREEYW